ncbi:hypothetical protein RJ640_002529 [Escallonia rubra]|uniref:Erythromycin biosynthesis protein CIII-like C-terminal domain-containing protein n=1 Tax=Escallonia rubra TaxID=112253 RepID=A0AA88UUY4_9ASTE|nr:hypothetical protein RJ640_002529 [Escallonia rubra]
MLSQAPCSWVRFEVGTPTMFVSSPDFKRAPSLATTKAEVEQVPRLRTMSDLTYSTASSFLRLSWVKLGLLLRLESDFGSSLATRPSRWEPPSESFRLSVSKRVVVHHGGAGTTAAGLKAACPTTVVPFFGDQPFWGERVHAKGVGPPPIPVDEFSLDKLVEAIQFMLDPMVKERAVELAKAMENEDGVHPKAIFQD